MHRFMLPGTDVSATRLGFGCARLMRIPSRSKRQNVIAAALDAGIGYFDVAPMYGMGVAEAELARCLGNQRHDVTIATKFGIEARTGLMRNRFIQGAARRIINTIPALKKLARRHANLSIKARCYDVAAGKISLDRSLATFGVDHIGVLLMHEPALAELTAPDLVPWLESLPAAGTVGAWGVAGQFSHTAEIAEAFHDSIPVIQFDCDAVNRQVERLQVGRNRALVTFSPLHDIHERIRSRLIQDRNLLNRWNAVTGEDFSQPDKLAHFLLTYAVRVNPNGVVLYSTSSPRRIAQAVDWIERDVVSEDVLAVFLNLLEQTFPPHIRPI